MFEAANCSVVPAAAPSNAGIAGAGVILSFIFTATLALGMSASLIFQDFRACRRGDGKIAGPSCRATPATIRRKLLNSYSDQQIMQGIGLQSVGLAKASSLVPYHFFLIWMLSLLSMAVHNATLLALVHDFRRDWVLRWLRQFLMFVNLALSTVYGVYILQGIKSNIEPTLPIACVWSGEGGRGTAGDAALMYIGTGAVLAGNVIVFAMATWYLHSRAQRFYRLTQFVGIILMMAVAVGATVRVMLLSQAFGSPSVPLSDSGEKDWSFGQLLSLLLLLLPVISIIEIYRGEMKVPPPVDDKAQLLLPTAQQQQDNSSDADAAEMQNRPAKRPSAAGRPNNFDPNPFWGSQTSLFNKR